MIHTERGQWLFALSTCILLVLTALFSLHAGQIPVPAARAIHDFASFLGISLPGNALTPEQSAVFWYIRMPRILVALLSGAALAAAGAVRYARCLFQSFGRSRNHRCIIGFFLRRGNLHFLWAHVHFHVLHACLCPGRYRLCHGLCRMSHST